MNIVNYSWMHGIAFLPLTIYIPIKYYSLYLHSLCCGTLQLNEMSNTDVLQKIRQNYESALKVSNEEHEKRMEELNNKILSLEEELKQKVVSCLPHY